MNIELSKASDIEVARHLQAVVEEADKRRLLLKSYKRTSALMAIAAVRRAALRAAGVVTSDAADAPRSTWTPEVQAALDRGDVLDAGAVLAGEKQ